MNLHYFALQLLHALLFHLGLGFLLQPRWYQLFLFEDGGLFLGAAVYQHVGGGVNRHHLLHDDQLLGVQLVRLQLPAEVIFEHLLLAGLSDHLIIKLVPFASESQVGVVVATGSPFPLMNQHRIQLIHWSGLVNNGREVELLGILVPTQHLFVTLSVGVVLEPFELNHDNGWKAADDDS